MIILARERKSIDEQIQILDGKIEKAQERVKDLKAQRQELLDKKESIALQELYAVLQEKGMSSAQAVEIIRNS
ncbi:MAG TPA: hypothetical protein DEP57_08800 [Selenomonas sp.]|nr:hypothetical protein [Selenomonas sp.]